MPKQFITLSKHSEVVIETPAGLVRISWTGKRRQCCVETPEGMVAHRSVERALTGGKYLRLDEGRIVPTYRMLTPVLGENGELAGVQQPPVFRAVRAG